MHDLERKVIVQIVEADIALISPCCVKDSAEYSVPCDKCNADDKQPCVPKSCSRQLHHIFIRKCSAKPCKIIAECKNKAGEKRQLVYAVYLSHHEDKVRDNAVFAAFNLSTIFRPVFFLLFLVPFCYFYHNLTSL